MILNVNATPTCEQSIFSYIHLKCSDGFMEKELPSEGCSPAPSNCSFISEQEVHEGSFLHRQSPFLNLSQASPNAFSSFPRPDFLNNSVADSETSSRSSLDGSFLSKESSSEGMEKFRAQRSARKLSSSSSDSDGSELTVGGGSVDGDEPIVRKISKSKAAETSLPVARRLDAPRGRIANIRRESDCSLNNEVEHERLVKTSQQVSCAVFISALLSIQEMRRRAPSASSVGEPISIVTNVFLPHSCSPSPTRVTEIHKQCYSPSTHQMVRPNMPYSATPSPTQSPTRQRLLRSLSPITTKTALKRRYTAGVDEVETKRSCGSSSVSGVFVRNSTSPLVTDRSFPYTSAVPQEFVQPTTISVNWTSSSSSSSSGGRRFSTLDSILERRTSSDSMEERKSVDEVDTNSTEMNGLSSEVDVQQSGVSSKEVVESESCAMCVDECSCTRKSSNEEETQPEQRIACPYEPFLRSD
ncbi:hypothetical protein OSTOST_04469 [Ostertagia ostertagi]